ncbi:MAG TPA: hypothetical protein VK961_22970 [Chthoniobacter sp.]|nr:hypothetical protein [Chthoniobacter sp.]
MPPIKHTALSRSIVSTLALLVMLALVLYGAIGARTEWMWMHAMRPRTFVDQLAGPPISREEVLLIARSYAEHIWTATAQNGKHGPDARGIDVQTPDTSANKAEPGKWRVGEDNIGMPYKWGGFDTPQSFDAGVAEGKAAGDVYSSTKRRLGDAAVSDEAVGIDCSGFISRCWKLPHKCGTATLPGYCELLKSTDDLQPGDVMDSPNGHVVLFVHWLNVSKSKALFYEAEARPQPRVMLTEHSIFWLSLCGARPFRYLLIGD